LKYQPGCLDWHSRFGEQGLKVGRKKRHVDHVHGNQVFVKRVAESKVGQTLRNRQWEGAACKWFKQLVESLHGPSRACPICVFHKRLACMTVGAQSSEVGRVVCASVSKRHDVVNLPAARQFRLRSARQSSDLT